MTSTSCLCWQVSSLLLRNQYCLYGKTELVYLDKSHPIWPQIDDSCSNGQLFESSPVFSKVTWFWPLSRIGTTFKLLTNTTVSIISFKSWLYKHSFYISMPKSLALKFMGYFLQHNLFSQDFPPNSKANSSFNDTGHQQPLWTMFQTSATST